MSSLKKYRHWYFLGAVAAITFLIWYAVFYFEARRGKVFFHVFDVGQGDAILIEAANGNRVLVDGGPDAGVLNKIGQTLPFWDRAIDLAILTHPHADHLDGLVSVLGRYSVGMVLESGVNHSIPEYAEWAKDVREKGIKRVVARRGEVIHLGQGVDIRVLAPFESFDGVTVKNVHDAAVVLELKHASSTVLLMADAEAAVERKMIAAGDDLRAEVLKVGHHGSKTSTSERLLEKVKPRWAVVSAGRRNRYGHPTQEVLDRLKSFGAQVLRTDQDGDIDFASDGRGFILAPR